MAAGMFGLVPAARRLPRLDVLRRGLTASRGRSLLHLTRTGPENINYLQKFGHFVFLKSQYCRFLLNLNLIGRKKVKERLSKIKFKKNKDVS